MPRASETERRAAIERQLHQDVTARAWAKAYEWEQHRARQAAAKAHAEAAAAQPADVVPAAPVAPVVLSAPRPASIVPAPEPEPADVVDNDQGLVPEELTPEQLRNWRVRGLKDHQVVSTTSTGTARRPRGGCSAISWSTRCSAFRARTTWFSGTPPGGMRERGRGVRGRPGPGRAAVRDGGGAEERRRPYGAARRA
ncbi:hypothetical protein ACFRCI_47825 [Streptomyces sp. NPDC056638]|uniref:hypothetical protein n=1 Tax=Streptomyces sp. NPDC056638 TaxID=3345887 RepID=UPI0036B2A853